MGEFVTRSRKERVGAVVDCFLSAWAEEKNASRTGWRPLATVKLRGERLGDVEVNGGHSMLCPYKDGSGAGFFVGRTHMERRRG